MFPRSINVVQREFGSATAAACVAVLSAACALLVWHQGAVPCDDAYITFRHVRNLLEAGRPAWNLTGEPVLGSTTPAFLWALAGYAWIARPYDIPAAALQLNAILHGMCVVFAYLAAWDLTGRKAWAWSAAALVGVNSVCVFTAAQGFESAMLIAVLLACLYFARTSRYSAALLLASLAPLIRPEGLLASFSVWGLVLARRSFGPRMFMYYVPLPFAWIIFSLSYYGSPAPQPTHAIARFPMSHFPYSDRPVDLIARLPGAPLGAVALWRRTAGPLLTSGTVDEGLAAPLPAVRLAFMGAGPLAALWLLRSARGRFIYILFPPAFLLLYGWLGHTKPWYFPSLVALFIVISVGGWALFVGCATLRLGLSRPRMAQGVRFFALPIVFLVMLSANYFRCNHGEYEYMGRSALFAPHPWGVVWDLWEAGRYREYRKAAQFLNARSSAPKTALTSEVGVFGFFFGGEVIDSVGLCSPESLQFFPPPRDDVYDPAGRLYSPANTIVPAAMITGLEPHYVVNSRIYIASLLRPDGVLTTQYRQIAEFGNVFGEPLSVFERVHE